MKAPGRMKVYGLLAVLQAACMLGLSTGCRAGEPTPDKYRRLRAQMVATQIEERGIRDPRVLAAMGKVPRHRFVPSAYRRKAYGDHPLPIGEGQTISQPYIVALMSTVLELKPSDRVLEVGTGSGYQAAVLAELCQQVFSIEIIAALGEGAARLLEELGYEGVEVRVGDGYQGWPEQAPFDAVIVTCAPSHVPEPLKRQLAEGGRMVIPVGDRFIQHLVLLQKTAGRIEERGVIPVRFVPMVDEDGRRY